MHYPHSTKKLERAGANMPSKAMKTIFTNLRIFSHPLNGKEHSYYVGHEAGGLSGPMETLAVDPSSTFSQLRDLIQEQSSGNVMRRRLFYTDFISFASRCPNPLGYDGKDLTTYRLGLLSNNGKDSAPDVKDIKVVKKSEESKRICEVAGDLFGTDIILIPTTQIHPYTDRLSNQL